MADTAKKVAVTKGNLLNGLDSMEAALGLQPGQATFINEYYASPSLFPDLAEPADWVKGDMAATLSPVVMAGKSAKLLTLTCPAALLSYLSAAELISAKPNIIMVTNENDLTERRFPDAAIINFLNDRKDQFNDVLSGQTLVPSFSTPEAISCAKAFNGAVLLTPQQSIDFNSKAYLRKVCEEEGISMPPGIILPADEPLEDSVQRFLDKAKKEGLPTAPAWLKLPSVAGGGTIPLVKGPNLEEMEEKIVSFMHDASSSYTNNPLPAGVNSFNNIPTSMKREMVMEYHLNALSGFTILDNFCCQAVIGNDGVTYMGTTGQVTEDGDYVGGKTLTKEDENLLKEVMPEIEKVFVAYQKRGYRGYIGVDALVASCDGKVMPFILETNCRMNASTPLLSIVQKVSKLKDVPYYGESVTFPVSVTDGSTETVMQGILNYFNKAGLLYEKGKNEGVIPFMPDVFPGRANPEQAKVRCAIVGETVESVRNLRSKIDARLSAGR